MSIKKFIQNVFSPTESSMIISGLRENIKNAEENVIKILEVNDKDVSKFNTYVLLDKWLRTETLTSKTYKKDTLFEYLQVVTQRLIDKQNDLIRYYEKSFNADVTLNGLDYRRANLLHLAASIDFFLDYVVKATALITEEAVSSNYPNKKLARLYRDQVSSVDKLRAFAVTSSVLGKIGKSMIKELDALADIPFVVESAEHLESTYRDKLNVTKSNLVPLVGHVSLFIGDVVNTFIKWRYDRAEALLDLTRIELMYAKRDREGNLSPEERVALEKQIENLQKRIAVLETKMESMLDA